MNKRSNMTIEGARPWLTPAEAAELTAQSIATIRRQCYSGILPSRKFGRSLRIPSSAIFENMKAI